MTNINLTNLMGMLNDQDRLNYQRTGQLPAGWTQTVGENGMPTFSFNQPTQSPAQPPSNTQAPTPANPAVPSQPAPSNQSGASSAAQAASQIGSIRDQLQSLKSQVQSGSLSVTQYMPQVATLVQQANTLTNTWAQRGQSAALQVNPPWQQIQDMGFVKADAGKWVPLSGFSTTEYAALPNNVLPTQNDLQSGLLSPTSVPLQRIQTSPNSTPSQPSQPPTVAPIPTSSKPTPAVMQPLPPAPTNSQPPTQTNSPLPTVTPTIPQSSGQPLPQVNTALPNTIDTTTDQGKASLQGQQNAQQLQDVLDKQYGINTQAVQQLASGISSIPGIYQQEGQSQQNQLNALADQQKTSRAQALQDLASTLAGNQKNLFNRAIPDLAEQANTSGIYRSTGFGDILANKYANLTADTQNQLALQGLSDRNSYLQAQQDALGTGLGYSGQAAQALAQGQQTIGSAASGALQSYGAGLGDVANAQIGMQNAGLQRQFSLQDYATQYANALNLANASRTQGPSGKSSPGSQAGIQTALGVGQLGATAYGGYAGKAGSQALANAYTSRNA